MPADSLPPLSENDKREVCDLHGWVGRRVYQRDRHDLCEAPRDEYSDEDLEEEPEELHDVEPSVEVEPIEDPPRWSRAEAKRQGIPAKKTIAVRRITQAELAVGRLELQALGADEPYDRPKTRGDCARVPRPCPYVACKHSLYLDVSETGSIILNFPHLDPGEMPANQSCALDLADQGTMTLEEIAVVTNLTRERIRQVELKALNRRARETAVKMGLGPDDAVAAGTRRRVGPGEPDSEGAVPNDESGED